MPGRILKSERAASLSCFEVFCLVTYICVEIFWTRRSLLENFGGGDLRVLCFGFKLLLEGGGVGLSGASSIIRTYLLKACLNSYQKLLEQLKLMFC